MTLTKIHPFSEFERISDMLDRLSGGSVPQGHQNGQGVVPMDIMEKEGTLIIHASLPGIAPEAIDVSIDKGVLTIKGELKHAEDLTEAKVYRREVVRGEMSRSIRLPDNLDLENVSATFAHGLVTITLPRQPEEKPKAIKVQVSESAS